MKSRKLYGLIATLIMALVLIFAFSAVSFAEGGESVYVCSYDLSEGGYLYNNGTVADSSPVDESMGYAYYDQVNKVLTLHNAVLNAIDAYMPPVNAQGNLCINLEGTNSIHASNNSKMGIYVPWGGLTISGDGSLDIDVYVDEPIPEGYSYSSSCSSYGVYTDGDIAINSGNINIASCSEYGESFGIYSWSGNVDINNANVIIDVDGMQLGDAIHCDGNITIPDGHTLLDTSLFNDSNQTSWEGYDFQNYNYVKVVSGKLTELNSYGVWVNGVKLRDRNPYWKNGDKVQCSGTSQDYNAYYDKEREMLTLYSAVITEAYKDTFDDILIYSLGSITVNAIGTNVLTYSSADNSVIGINSDGNLILCGNGDVTISLNTSEFMQDVVGVHASNGLFLNGSNVILNVSSDEEASGLVADYLECNNGNFIVNVEGRDYSRGFVGYDGIKIVGGNIHIDTNGGDINALYSNNDIVIPEGHSINDGSELFGIGRTTWSNDCFNGINIITITDGVITNAKKYEQYTPAIFLNSDVVSVASVEAGATDLDGVTLKASASVSGSTVNVTIKNDDLDKFAEQALTPSGNPTGITLDLSKVGSGVSTVSFDTATIKKINEIIADNSNDVAQLDIKLQDGTLMIYRETLKSIESQAQGKKISISFNLGRKAEDSMTSVQKETFKGFVNPLAIGAEINSDGKTISDFGGGSIAIRVNYQSDKALVGWCLDDDGSKSNVPCIYDGKTAVIVALHFSHYIIEESNVSFDDVLPEYYCYDAVNWAVGKGITSGKVGNSFAPFGICTRGEFVTFLWRAAGKPVVDYYMPFIDVDENEFYAEAVRWAASEGIIKGKTDTIFDPWGPITRAQAITCLWRYAKAPAFANMTANGPASSPFTDVPTDEYYYSAVLWAKAQGITNGKLDGIFAPYDNCLRGQVVSFLFNYLGK